MRVLPAEPPALNDEFPERTVAGCTQDFVSSLTGGQNAPASRGQQLALQVYRGRPDHAMAPEA
jgi:hypothetical protein